ncbi:hypothetical protein L7F22_004312 [Adiantum nelumboides]|nr:hypothetical protein [Adiantum nelumboides]
MRRTPQNQMEGFESHGNADCAEEEDPTTLSSTCSSPAQEVGAFESSLWGDLPQDLIDRVLAFLPPICLFRLQRVCRRWQSLINEHGFLCLLSQLPSHGPCFLMAQKDGESWHLAVYSYPMRIWHSLPLALIPKQAHSLVASAGGLLCFAGLEGHHDELFVCSPFRQECRRLPNMHHMRQLGFVSMFMDKRARCYRIVAAGECSYWGNNRAIPTEVYDSNSNTWAVFHSFPARSLQSMRSAYCNGRLYCLTLSPSRLVAFDIERGIWETMPVGMPRALLDAFLIAGECGRLLLVGRVSLYSVHQSMRVWELNFVYMDWVEIGRMPHMLFRALLRSSSAESFQCFGYGNFICFSAHKQQRWLMQDSLKKTWHWFGNCPHLSSYPSKRTRGFFFVPRLDATLV